MFKILLIVMLLKSSIFIKVKHNQYIFGRTDTYKPSKLTHDIEVDKITVDIEKPQIKPKVKPINKFKEALGKRESSGNYNAVKGQYLGKYQFGHMALRDLGYKDSKNKWLGKNDISSNKDFLSNEEVQELAMDNWEILLEKRLELNGSFDYIGEYFAEIKLTKNGLKAAAHLVGPTAIIRMLKTGEIPEDDFGTKATEYLDIMKSK